MKKLLLISFLIFPAIAFCQQDTTTYDLAGIQVMPEFSGGQEALLTFIAKNTIYPDSAIKNGIQGVVRVSFVVEKDGSISNVQAVGSKVLGYGLEEESVRVVKLLPKFKPGMQNGEPVRVKLVVPIKFRLR